VLGTALTARAVLPVLARSGGHLLLTGSVAGRVTRPGACTRPPSGRWARWRPASAPSASARGSGSPWSSPG
jgi:NAD(P)-dependent dehydrogenase (short-subunit alcohol dehydrogenase family)